MRFYGLVVGILGVWRIAHLLNAEDGPWQVFVRLRRRVGSGFWGELLDCFYCLSLSVAIPFAALIGQRWQERVLLWPALSAGAILIERISWKRDEAAVTHWEEHEVEHGMLREEQKQPDGHDKADHSSEIRH